MDTYGDKDMNETKTIASFDLRSFFKRWPSFYYGIATVFGPMYFSGLSSKRFLRTYQREGKTLNIGSGPRILGDGVTNVDIHPYPGVEIVIDGARVPLADGSVARIVSDNVLEHVPDPRAAVKEMHRLLEGGGLVYFSAPFLYPFHSSPDDYQRWTKLGLSELFREFEIIQLGVRCGPFSALTALVNHTFAIAFSFGSPRVASLLLNLVMFVTFPIKLPDLVFNRLSNADQVASVFYLVAKKR
jgi:SAM-dependent methyltransferase